MLTQISSNHIEYDIKTYRHYRNHRTYEPDKVTKQKAAIGAIAGTLVPMICISAIQKKNILNINYGIKEMLIISSGSIVGGLFAGLMSDRKENYKQKIHESVFQFLNASIPSLLTASLFAIGNKFKFLNNNFYKFTSTAVGLFAGMQIAAKLANKINDPHNKIPDRKLTYKDTLANIDDAMGALVLAKIPIAEKLKAEKILPIIYSWCGYRVGTSN